VIPRSLTTSPAALRSIHRAAPARRIRTRKLEQLALVGVRALLENNEGVRRFAPAFMREPDDRDLFHG